MNKLLTLLLVVLSASVNASTISFNIEPPTGCVDTSLPCQAPTSYAVYVVGTNTPLVTSSTTATAPVPFQMDIGVQYCFEATASNDGGE